MAGEGFEELLLRGVAAAMAAIPTPRVALTHRPDGASYAPGELGIYLDRYPESVDSVTLTDYVVSDDLSLSDSVVGVQFTIKAARRATIKAISSDVFDLLHGRGAGMLGGVRLVSAMRSSGTNMGQDSSGRQGRLENYYLTVHRPSPNRS